MKNFKITFHCAPDEGGKSAVILHVEAETTQTALLAAASLSLLREREIITVEICEE